MPLHSGNKIFGGTGTGEVAEAAAECGTFMWRAFLVVFETGYIPIPAVFFDYMKVGSSVPGPPPYLGYLPILPLIRPVLG
jgi:hypothetical protein